MFSLQTIFGSGKQFYLLLDRAAQAAHDSTVELHAMLRAPEKVHALDAFKLARQRERTVSDEIGKALVETFITPIEREDIESLASALYKIPKQVEKFADRYMLARHQLAGIDFAPRAAMLEQAASVVVEMVGDLQKMHIDRMTSRSERLRVLETEADRLMLELYRDIFGGTMEVREMFLLKEFFEILEKAIDRCREAGVVCYQIVLKNS